MTDKRKVVKEIFNFLLKWVMRVIVVIVIVALVYTVYTNFKNNDSFWNASVTNILTIVVAMIFAYYFVQKNNDKRKQKEIIENNIKKIQNYIYDDEIYNIESKDKNSSLTRSMKIRKISNLITYLSEYASKFKFVKEMEEVSKNFLEYRSCTEEMTQDNDFSDKGKNHSKRIIETLDDNLEEILHKIYL